MKAHLHHDGFLRSYKTWTWHGELLQLPRVSVTEEYVGSTMDGAVHDDVDDDRLKDMIRDVGAESFCRSAWIWKYVKRCRDSIVSWIN